MHLTFELRPDPARDRRLARAVHRRTRWRQQLEAAPSVLVWALWGWYLPDPASGWTPVIALLVLVLLYLGIVLANRIAWRRQAARQRGGPVTVEITDEAVTYTEAHAYRRYAWAGIRYVEDRSGFWIARSADRWAVFAFPEECMGPEQAEEFRAFVLARTRSAATAAAG